MVHQGCLGLQALDHRIEGAAQLAEFILGIGHRNAGEFTGRYSSGAVDQMLDRLVE